MFLYNQDGNKIEVFDMQPYVRKTIDYKKEQIARSFGVDGSIFQAVTNSQQDKILEQSSETVMLRDLDYNRSDLMGDRWFSSLKQVDPNEETRTLLANYYTNAYQRDEVKKVVEYTPDHKKLVTLKYLLLTRSWYSSGGYGEYYRMTNIIELNQSLFHLHLLEQGQFARLAHEEISEQLALFNIKHDRDISIKALKEMYDVDLLPGAFELVMQTVETTGKILQKIK